MNDSKTVAEYVRMAEDCLEQSWERDTDGDFKLRAVMRAQVYATLAVATATAADKARQLANEDAAHYERLESLEREL